MEENQTVVQKQQEQSEQVIHTKEEETIQIQEQIQNMVLEQKKCDNCAKQGEKLSKCGGCNSVKYCSQTCQKEHWKTHKKNCAYFKKKELESLPLYKGIDWFDMESNIGHGNFSEIWRARCKKDEKKYAIKVIQKQRIRQLNKEKDFYMEKHCLQKLSGNPYFIEFYGNFDDEMTFYMQLEYVPGGELWDQCKIFGIVSMPLFKYYFAHIILAVEQMHSKGIVHRDLKGENIMVTKDHKIKLIDFGTAADLENPHITGAGQGGKGKKNYQHFVGTPNYMAPEQIRNKGTFYGTDIYALAGIAFQLWGGFPAWNAGSEYLIFKQSLVEDPVFPDCLFINQPQLKDLILGMCKKDVDERLTIEQIKNHEFWKGFDFENIPEFDHFENQTIAPAGKFLLETKKHLLASEKKVKDNKKQYKQEIDDIQQKLNNDPSLSQIELLQQRLNLMKHQGRILINSEEHLFSYKDDFNQGFEPEQKEQVQIEAADIKSEEDDNDDDEEENNNDSDDDKEDKKQQQQNEENNNNNSEQNKQEEEQSTQESQQKKE